MPWLGSASSPKLRDRSKLLEPRRRTDSGFLGVGAIRSALITGMSCSSRSANIGAHTLLRCRAPTLAGDVPVLCTGVWQLAHRVEEGSSLIACGLRPSPPAG